MTRGIVKIVFISIPILALIALGFAAIMRWRETGKRQHCVENLRRLGFEAMWTYTDREFAFPRGTNRLKGLPPDAEPDPNKTFPAGTLANVKLPPERRLSWQVALLPYLGQEEAYRRFDFTKAWDDERNDAAIRSRVTLLVCPALFGDPEPGAALMGSYVGVAGLGLDAPNLSPTDKRAGFFRYDEPTKTGMIKRGLSYTLTILETDRDAGSWAAGGRPTVRGLDTKDVPYIGIGRQFGAHPGGCNAAFADGSVRFQANSISPSVLEMLVPLADER